MRRAVGTAFTVVCQGSLQGSACQGHRAGGSMTPGRTFLTRSSAAEGSGWTPLKNSSVRRVKASAAWSSPAVGGTQERWNSSSSRFTRQSGSGPPNAGANGGGAAQGGLEKYGINPAGCSGQQFLSFLHRLRAEYKQQPTDHRRWHCLRLLRQLSLKRVTHMDGRIVFQLLDLLARLQAPGEDFVLLQEAASWLALYGSSPSTSPALVPQCLRSLLQLDSREVLMPVLLGCRSALTALESQQRTLDSCVVLLAALLRGLSFHDRRTTTSHQLLLPVVERLLMQVTGTNMEHASSTDLRLLLDAFGAARRHAPDLFIPPPSEGGASPWWECVEHVRRVLAHDRAEEISGSLTLFESLQLVQNCQHLFPLPAAGTTEPKAKSIADDAPWHPDEIAVRDMAVRRATELLANRSAPVPSSLVPLLQDIALWSSSHTAEHSAYQPLYDISTQCLEEYFSVGEASADMAVTVIRLCVEAAGMFPKEETPSPVHPLSLLLGPPIAPPTGCGLLHPEAHDGTEDGGAFKGSASAGGSEHRKVDLDAIVHPTVLKCVEQAWETMIPKASLTTVETTRTTNFVWSASSVETLIRAFALDPKYQDKARHLRQHYFTVLKATFSQAPGLIAASDFSPFFMEDATRETYFEEVVSMVTACMAHWSVSQVLLWLRMSATVPCSTAIRLMMRAGAKSLAPFMDRASGEQLVALMYYYGHAGVRQEEFCDAVAKRMGKLCEESASRTPEEMHGGLLNVIGLSIILRGFAAVEYRPTKPFLDAAPVVMRAISGHFTFPEMQTAEMKEAGEEDEVTPPSAETEVQHPATPVSETEIQAYTEAAATLLAAYAKMLVWHFKVVWTLAEYLSLHTRYLTLRQLLVAQLALLRMDVRHEGISTQFKDRVQQWAESGQPDNTISNTDLVALLSVWSRAITRNGPAEEGSETAVETPPVAREAFLNALTQRRTSLSPVEQAEALLSLARLGEGRDGVSSPLFEELTTQIIGTLPQATPLALSHVVHAYALLGRTHPELFSLVSQRVIRIKNETAAVTIASILSAFASTGYEDTILFMEMIPRVRFVAQFGTVRDVTNVVFAYATVKVWHYKLFSRLADRAIQLRSEFSPVHLLRLLQAYAMVGMRYDSLFTEMAVRLQVLAHLLHPKELCVLLESYAAVNMICPPVFEACADQAEKIATSFALSEAERFLQVLEDTGYVHPRVWLAFHNQFPEQLRGRYLSVQQKTMVNAQTPSESDDANTSAPTVEG